MNMDTTNKNTPTLRDLGYYTESEVAALYGVKQVTLRNWRNLGIGPPFCKVQGRLTAYAITGVRKDLERRTVRPTSK
jgi:hypothetical protein